MDHSQVCVLILPTDIHRVAGDLALQQQQRGGGGGGEPPSSEGPDIVSPPPLDPNLVCQHCGRGYRVLEIQLFRRHVEQCAGGGGGGGGGRETPHAQHLGSAEWVSGGGGIEKLIWDVSA